MTLHPISVVDHVLDEYRSYLRTEFQARDPKLRKALEDALDRPLFLAQEPFFQAHRPFKDGKRWGDLPLDAKLAAVMAKRAGGNPSYLHQSEAIEHLLGSDATPLVVTTGTGSGKTEAFLMPVLQNAIMDAARFSRSGLTALLVYPMNALANDQEKRIREYLDEAGFANVLVERYDRTTKEDTRAEMRKNPPHILLTNYMMLEYLLVRPADREAIFRNHRCRFLVLDEVHTYRGALGANVALLIRRVRAHLAAAHQDWMADKHTPERFPKMLCVGTSATIKSVDETGKTPSEVRKLRDEAVQEFFGRLSGEQPGTIRVLGEEIKDVAYPAEAAWAALAAGVTPPAHDNPEAVRKAMARLAGLPESASLEESTRRAKIVWFLSDLLAKKPMSINQIVDLVAAQVPERSEVSKDDLRREIEAALVAASALPEQTPGVLRLRSHRFVRGGWRFHRCTDPTCGKLFAGGEAECGCGSKTAPLYLCRSCGAHAFGYWGDQGDPGKQPLQPSDPGVRKEPDWFLYEEAVNEEEVEQEDDPTATSKKQKTMKGREVRIGSFDPQTCSFASVKGHYRVSVTAAPARNTCLVCAATAGAGSILTPVELGTSAAVRVLAEGLVEVLYKQNRAAEKEDQKQRLLVFADSRQDAAHQARFMTYAARYDRMRRLLVRILREAEDMPTLQQAVQALMVEGTKRGDNPFSGGKDVEFLSGPVQARAKAWEEVPLLDDMAVSAGYRATVFNLGLVGVMYDRLIEYVEKKGQNLAAGLGVSTDGLHHVCRCLLDEMRTRRAVSRMLLRYHPGNPNSPREELDAADWERRIKTPQGFAWRDGGVCLYIDREAIANGIQLNNFWRKPKSGGRGPSIERIFKHLIKRLGGKEATEDGLSEVLAFLMSGPEYLVPVDLHGWRDSTRLLQVNEDVIRLGFVRAKDRVRSSLSNLKMPWSAVGLPCPRTEGTLEPIPQAEFDQNRYIQRILSTTVQPLVAREHTAQVTGDDRITIEEDFKASSVEKPLNVLACSPTLEMGIDVGGLDAVMMRNVPPRPDNYAQRGGRAGRRSRIGIVLSYARNRPHDAYFFDKPAEMIAGEVPAPVVSLGNRDVLLRHLAAIAFGMAEPGLSGKMASYVTIDGKLVPEAIDALLTGLKRTFPATAQIAVQAWGASLLAPLGLSTEAEIIAELDTLPNRVQDVFQRVARQINELDQMIERWKQLEATRYAATNAMSLKCRLLGIPEDNRSNRKEADDRSSGHPMRRFAEFGILPGYEFPSEPASLRLMGDDHEEETISVERRFGIGQYQPGATVHARGHKWRVEGLDNSSPWNPKGEDPSFMYIICGGCGHRYDQQDHAKCPRCQRPKEYESPLPAYEYGGFLARRHDTPVLEEEDRIASAAAVRCFPQWDGQVVGRYELPTGWNAQLRKGEGVVWLNESAEPSKAEFERNAPRLHDKARGFHLCASCGRMVRSPEPDQEKDARKKPSNTKKEDDLGHAKDCPSRGTPPKPFALAVRSQAWTWRMVVTLPKALSEADYKTWGLSLGTALEIGLKRLYSIDDREVSFELEDLWEIEGGRGKRGAITFVDAALGGSGFLDRAAKELPLIAATALEHLEHEGCETACYRCLKSYQNQRFHEFLYWPSAMNDLEVLAAQPPVELPKEVGDHDDPKPWLEAYEAGVGSPLELKFLTAFERLGIEVEKQVGVGPTPEAARISLADFVVKGKPIAIYVDGAAFHVGMRLRRDRFIRTKLTEGGYWKVVVFTAKDLAKGDEYLRGEIGG